VPNQTFVDAVSVILKAPPIDVNAKAVAVSKGGDCIRTGPKRRALEIELGTAERALGEELSEQNFARLQAVRGRLAALNRGSHDSTQI
jgi:hypothetical protein